MGDAVGRYGGEEFALVLNDVDERRAVAMLERVLTRFRLIEHRLRGNARLSSNALGERHLKAQAARHRECARLLGQPA